MYKLADGGTVTADGRGRREGRQRNTSLKWNIQADGLWDGSMMESGEEEEETGKDVWGQPFAVAQLRGLRPRK